MKKVLMPSKFQHLIKVTKLEAYAHEEYMVHVDCESSLRGFWKFL